MSLPLWSNAPIPLVISPGTAHIIRLDLDLPEPQLADLYALLSADEQARAQRLVVDLPRRRWIAARGQMRQVLGICLGCAPAHLCFEQNAFGKPALSRERAALHGSHLAFNLTHSEGVGLLAMMVEVEVGIDAEAVRERVDWRAIANRFFAPAELKALDQLPTEQQRRAFYQVWVRKEAYLKAHGQGLSLGLDTVEVTLVPGQPPNLRGAPPDWTLTDIDLGSAYTAALVVAGKIDSVYCWQWTINAG